jgi:phi13 family phage major tail protein
MAGYVGFKFLISKITKDGKEIPVVIRGAENKGATVSAKITGLAKDSTSTPGSDIEYYMNRRGVGTPKAELGVLDWPDDTVDRALGYQIDDDDGITRIGEDTLAPFVPLICGSKSLAGTASMLGFYKGTFARDEYDMNTLDPSKATEPEADTYTYIGMTSDQPGKAKGHVMAKITTDEIEKAEAFMTEILGEEVFTALKASDDYPYADGIGSSDDSDTTDPDGGDTAPKQ